MTNSNLSSRRVLNIGVNWYKFGATFHLYKKDEKVIKE